MMGMEERIQSSSLIVLSHVKKQYELGQKQFMAVNDINLEISKGEFVAIVGKSGSGKSTLLNLMSGIDKVTEGKIIVKGEEISSSLQKELTRFRGEHIGIVFQFFQLLPTLTVLENVILPMDFNGQIKKGNRRLYATQLLEKVGMKSHQNKLPSELSGGEQQRVAIARALANDPEIIFADEPTGNLDSHTTEEIFSLLRQLSQEGKTIIMVTHNNELAARCDRMIRISDGRVIEDTSRGEGGEKDANII